jgi:Ser/Thr protein kinase RdoA (MazF antagonist)
LSAENFDDLTPERILAAAETALDQPFHNVVLPLPSYINRVYELESAAGERLIFKFYRPRRWSRSALLEEHLFLLDCAAEEIPVAPPLRFPGGGTLRETDDGIHFAAFVKRGGRPLEINDDEAWRRLGALLGRLHTVGERRAARFRLRLDPETTTGRELDHLLDSGLVGSAVRREFERAANDLYELIADRFEPADEIRLHGDCHAGNILNRLDEGLLLIDFDDMMSGPAAQDIWLLLPGYAGECRRELDLLLRAYRRFRDFPERETGRLELLRGMRMIYFLDWCARQSEDFNFADRYPEWGTDNFWRRETAALRGQFEVIKNHVL